MRGPGSRIRQPAINLLMNECEDVTREEIRHLGRNSRCLCLKGRHPIESRWIVPGAGFQSGIQVQGLLKRIGRRYWLATSGPQTGLDECSCTDVIIVRRKVLSYLCTDEFNSIVPGDNRLLGHVDSYQVGPKLGRVTAGAATSGYSMSS